MALRTVIAEDEPLARQLLEKLLQESPEIDLIASCKNGREAVDATLDQSPDLLILDIQMPGLTGFDVIKELQSDLMPMIIFCTAYQRYAVDAFDLHAVDYVLKPVQGKRLQRAIERALVRHAEQDTPSNHKQSVVGAIDEISKKVSGRGAADRRGQVPLPSPESDQKMAIKDGHHTVLVKIADIDWVDAAGDYMCVHAAGETHVMRSTLKSLMERLEEDTFKRIHRSTIVNLNRIEEVSPLPKGEYMLHLDCGERLKVSRNYRAAIKVFLDQL